MINSTKKQITPRVNGKVFPGLSILLLVLLVLAISAIFYMFYQNIKMREELVSTVNDRVNKGLLTSSLSEETAKISSELKSIDDIWYLYTNHNLKFSMKIPKNIYHGYGSCEWGGTFDPSYRPVGAIVPVAIYELEDRVFISTSYYYELGGEVKKGYSANFLKCNKVDNSLSKLQDKNVFGEQKWEVKAAQVKTDADLEKFIKDNYGTGCKIGKKKASSQNGVFDVLIDNGGFDLAQSIAHNCGINYMYYLKYSPQRHEAITWIFGQAYSFPKNAGEGAYDNDMVKSFRFVE